MPQDPLHLRQLCPALQHPPGQTVAQHVWGDIFQPPGQVHERLAACDVSLALGLSAQALRGASPELLHRSLCHPLGDSYLCRLPFRRHRNPDQKLLPFLVTADGWQSSWATHALKIAAEKTLGISMKRNGTSSSRLPTAHRKRATS